MTTEAIRGGPCCTQVTSWVVNNTSSSSSSHAGCGGGGEENHIEVCCCKKNALCSMPGSGGFHHCHTNNLRGSSTASTATCSSASIPQQAAAGGECMTDKVMGVVSSVKTLGRNPVLATLIWLLGGSTTEVEVPRDHESRHGRGIRRHRWQSSVGGAASHPGQQHNGTNHHHNNTSSSSASDADRQGQVMGDKVVLFLGDRHESVRLDHGRGPVMATRRHGGGTSDSQCMYPEHIAVEKITHMDRVESDDLLPATTTTTAAAYHHQQQLAACGESSSAGAANGADMSPQWGWYVTLTPPQAEFFAKEAVLNKARTRPSQDLRPPMP